MRRVLALLFLLAGTLSAAAQAVSGIAVYGAPADKPPVNVAGTFSATLGGFAPATQGTPITATTSGVTGTLPAGAVVVVSNVGTTNTAYCSLGASATLGAQPIAPNGGWFAYTVGANTQITCITSASTTTVNLIGGAGLATGTGGGGGAGGGTSSNITQFGGTNISTGTGVSGLGIPRVTVSSDSFPATQAISAVALPLPTGAATSANQTNAAQKTQIVDGSGNVIASTSNNLNVQCANCSGSGVSTADQATFTAGASLFAGGGGFFQTTPTANPLTTGKQGMFQTTAQRALFVNQRDSSGNEIGISGAPFFIGASSGALADGSIVALGAQADASWSGSGNATLVALGKAIYNATIAPIPTGSNVIGAVTQSGGPWSISASSLPLPTGAATSALQPTNAAQGSTTAGETGHLVMGAVTTAAPSYTTGQTSPISLDLAGNVRINCITGCAGSGGTSSSFGAAFPATGTAAGAEYLSSAPTLTSGQMVALQTDVNGNLLVAGVGTPADTAWSGSGNGTIDAVTKAIYNATIGPTPAGTNIIGKVGIDQTTPGVTDAVTLLPLTGAQGGGLAGQSSAALEASSVAITGNKNLYSAYAVSTTGAAGYFVCVNATSISSGAITPKDVVQIPAGPSSALISFGSGPPGNYGTGVTCAVTVAATPFTYTSGGSVFFYKIVAN